MIRIGVDVGGTKIAAGIVQDGKILIKGQVPAKEDVALENTIAKLCIQLTKDYGLSINQIASIGIGLPGAVDSNTAHVINAPNLEVANRIVSQDVSRLLNNMPVYFENDANCAALAEHAFGASKGVKSSLLITLGTGIGGGVIIDNNLYRGTFFGAGEIGHHVVVVNGKLCNCGRKGCFEMYASARALEVSAGIKLPDFFKRIKAKDNDAIKKFNEYLEYLCEGLGNAINILQPEVVVIGGGLSGLGQWFADEINLCMKGKVFDSKVLGNIRIARFGNDAGIIGASLLGGNL